MNKWKIWGRWNWDYCFVGIRSYLEISYLERKENVFEIFIYSLGSREICQVYLCFIFLVESYSNFIFFFRWIILEGDGGYK